MDYNEFFTIAKEYGFTNVQIIENTKDSNEITVNNGKLDLSTKGFSITYTIKAEYKDKTVKIVTDYLDESVIEELAFKAENTDSEYRDDYLKNGSNQEDYECLTYDLSIPKESLYRLETYRNNFENVSHLHLSYSKEYNKIRIINNQGVDLIKDKFFTSLDVQSIAKDMDKTVSYERFMMSSDDEINLDSFVIDILEKSVLSLNEEEVSSGKYNILLSPHVIYDIGLEFIDMISASNIRNKTTCMLDKLNKKIFSSKLNIVEDPTNRNFPGYNPFDDEGTFTKKKDIVTNGKLKTYLYDIKEAKLAKKESTGNGYGSISARNMYIEKGNKSFDELVEQTKDGIYVTSYIGTNVINQLTGDLSLQIFGFVIKDGKIQKGLKTCILTTDIFELFSNIVDIGNDLTFVSDIFASPTILVKDLSIVSK